MRIIFAILLGICAFSSIGCNVDSCAWRNLAKTINYAYDINPELADAYFNSESPYYNGGNDPVDGFNHGQITSFKVRVNKFSEKLTCCP